MAKSQDEACVILGRDNPQIPWSSACLICSCYSLDVAWRSSFTTQKQEREILGHKQFEAIVVPHEFYDRGKYKAVYPPAGFDFKLNTAVVSDYVLPPEPVAMPRPVKSEPEPEVELPSEEELSLEGIPDI